MTYSIPEAGSNDLFQHDYPIEGGVLYCLLERIAGDSSVGISAGVACVGVYTGPGCPNLINYIDTAVIQAIEFSAEQEVADELYARITRERPELEDAASRLIPRFLSSEIGA